MDVDDFPKDAVFSKHPTGALNLAPGEFLVRCPYEKAHFVLNHRFDTHLRKCRGNYALAKEKKKENLVYLSCQFNWRHQVIAPELQYHEHGCQDKHKLPLVRFLRMTMEDDLNRIMEGNGIPFETTTSDSEDLSKENHEVIETEQKKRSAPKDAEAQMLSSRYANPSEEDYLVMTDHLRKLMVNCPSLDKSQEVIWADPKILEKFRSKRSAPSQVHLSQGLDPSFCQRSRKVRRREKEPFKGPAVKYSKEDEDYVWADEENNRPKFDWFLNQMRFTKQPSYSFPEGLTKAGRKEYIKLNGQQWLTHHGIESVELEFGGGAATTLDY